MFRITEDRISVGRGFGVRDWVIFAAEGYG